MAKKVFLDKESAITTAETPSVSRAELPSTTTNNPVSEQQTFRNSDQFSKTFKI